MNSKEMQELRSEFNDLKETLDEQRIVNKKLLENVQKQKAYFIGKDLKERLLMDMFTIPMIIVICIAIDWPMLFAAAVSVWALTDLVSVLWMKKKIGTRDLLDDDVLTVARKVKEYKKFYRLSSLIGAILAMAMTIYIISRIFLQGTAQNDMLPFLAFFVAIILFAIVRTIRKYKKQMASCDELIGSLENL